LTQIQLFPYISEYVIIILFDNYQVLPFINSLLLLNQLNRVVLIATGTSSCGYIFDSGEGTSNGNANAVCSGIVKKLEDFVVKDARLAKGSNGDGTQPAILSLLSGSLSLALCCILSDMIK
jgi:transcription initiation factor TFIIH subunit 3